MEARDPFHKHVGTHNGNLVKILGALFCNLIIQSIEIYIRHERSIDVTATILWPDLTIFSWRIICILHDLDYGVKNRLWSRSHVMKPNQIIARQHIKHLKIAHNTPASCYFGREYLRMGKSLELSMLWVCYNTNCCCVIMNW